MDSQPAKIQEESEARHEGNHVDNTCSTGTVQHDYRVRKRGTADEGAESGKGKEREREGERGRK